MAAWAILCCIGLSRSVYTRIARLALEEKGVRYTLEEVEIFGPAGVPAEHLARQPFGRIPSFRSRRLHAVRDRCDHSLRGRGVHRNAAATAGAAGAGAHEPGDRDRGLVLLPADDLGRLLRAHRRAGRRDSARRGAPRRDAGEGCAPVAARSRRFSAASVISPATSSRSRICTRCRSCCTSRWRAKAPRLCRLTRACVRGSTTWLRVRACSGPRASTSSRS